MAKLEPQVVEQATGQGLGRMGVTSMGDHERKEPVTAQEQNERFFARHEVALAQEKAVDGPFGFYGDHGDASLFVTRKEIGDDGRRAELELATAGHKWFLMEADTDTLFMWLSKIIQARASAKAQRAKRVAAFEKEKALSEAVRFGGL
jgi:hypothetical protein